MKKAKDLEKITDGEIYSALTKSGYLLESRLENILKDEYFVQANVSFPDQFTGKQRELDLCAVSAYPLDDTRSEFIFNEVIIECLNNPQPIAFIMRESQINELHLDALKFEGMPTKILKKIEKKPDQWLKTIDYLNLGTFHHYCEKKIASQYCSFTQKRQDDQWMAFHDETHFDAFSKLINATEYFLNDLSNNWTCDFKRKEPINIQFFHPCLVVQGEIIEVRQKKGSVEMKRSDFVQYRQTINKNLSQDDFHIDVVTEDYFPKYLRLLAKEMEKTAALVHSNRTSIEDSIKLIVSKVAEKIRPKFVGREDAPTGQEMALFKKEVLRELN